jgi:Tol biopolymer transport system component
MKGDVMNARVLFLAGCIALAAVAASSAAPSSERAAATTTRVSVSSSGGQGDLSSYAIAISGDGRFVAFSSQARTLVPGDTNDRTDTFVRDRATGRTTRVSVDNSGRQAEPTDDPWGGSDAEGISGDGRYVVFRSDAPNLVPGDTNGVLDVFVHDRKTGKTSRLSVTSTGRQANGSSLFGSISANGRYVVFTSNASNLVPRDTNGASDIFIRDRRTGRTSRVSVNSRNGQGNSWSEGAAVSADGRYVAFASAASNLVAGDTNKLPDVFVRDRKLGRTTRVSVTSRGGQGSGRRYSNGANAPSISADGRYVAFHSDMSNLVPRDTNRVFDIFVRDRVAGRTMRVSVSSRGAQANAESLGPPSVSPNGRYVAFTSLAANLVPGDRNEITDVFVRDLRTGRTILASLGSTGRQGNDSSWNAAAAFSANNRYLAFSAWASNLVAGDTNPVPDAFVRDFGGSPIR